MYRLRGQPAPARPYDPASLAPLRPLDESAITGLMAQIWLERFRAHRDHLRASVPGRSSQPDRYRDLITAVAGHVLRAALDGGISQADSNEALQAAFPEWFGRPGDDENTHHKHLSRARQDAQALLQAVVDRAELVP